MVTSSSWPTASSSSSSPSSSAEPMTTLSPVVVAAEVDDDLRRARRRNSGGGSSSSSRSSSTSRRPNQHGHQDHRQNHHHHHFHMGSYFRRRSGFVVVMSSLFVTFFVFLLATATAAPAGGPAAANNSHHHHPFPPAAAADLFSVDFSSSAEAAAAVVVGAATDDDDDSRSDSSAVAGARLLADAAFAGNSEPASPPAPPYPLNLQNIFVSHGNLEPSFSPERTSYSVVLTHAVDSFAISPEIDQSRPEYNNKEGKIPLVSVSWSGHAGEPEATGVAVRRQVDLPDDGSSIAIQMTVQNPDNLRESKTYTVTVRQSDEPIVLLKGLEAVDDLGNPVPVQPIVNEADVVYSLYCYPDASSISLKPFCAEGNWVKVNGNSVSNRGAISIQREKDHHRQVVELTCGGGGSGSAATKEYIVTIVSNYQETAIPPPDLVVEALGKKCTLVGDTYKCPNPHAKDYRTKLVGDIEPSVRYTVESSDNSVQVRLLDGTPTIPFSYTSVGYFNVVGLAGEHKRLWPLQFSGAPAPGLMRVLGWLLGLIFLFLLLSLLAALGISSICGIGTPIGVTEIATAMTLLLQFFCFTSQLHGTSLLANMTESFKWVTFFWPLPWRVDDEHASNFSVWGDVSNLHNAYGCLFWTATLFATLLLVHTAVIIRLRALGRHTTIPHRLAYGNWESRCLHWLVFPVSAASMMILRHPDAGVAWKIISGFLLALFAAWATAVFVLVRNAISADRALWVWQSSAREDGELEDEAGYWSDAICDQLLTQPVNRSLCKTFFPWRWVSTVADVQPVHISPQQLYRSQEKRAELFPPNELGRAHRESAYPLGKNPRTVDVVRTVHACPLFSGRRLITGLFRTQWLDVLFTYEGLTKFYQHGVTDLGRDFHIPLTVKTCQLTGPVTGGMNHFFFDGTRVPFVRIGDAIFRLFIGVAVGLVLALNSIGEDTSYVTRAICYGIIGALGIALLTYHCVGWPYSRTSENWVLGALLISIISTSLTMMGYAISESKPSVFADICLWLNAIASYGLAAYACVVIFSVFSAFICPPLEESRFLERLANCNVTISDDDVGAGGNNNSSNNNSGWAVDIPGYNKKGTKDLKAQCNGGAGVKTSVAIYPSGEDGSIELSVEEMVEACQGGVLRAPELCLWCPDTQSPLGYRHINIYDRRSLHADIAGFLAMTKSTRPFADTVARNIAHQVEIRGKNNKAVVSISVIPPVGST